MKVSIVTPSFNQAPYLEETIRSVLEQGYGDLEYIVIDGGSTDGSVDIIRKYADRLHYWVSEKDRGQTHAINKGMERATGEIRAYLNSDDYYLPGTIQKVLDYCRENPEVDLVHGVCRYVDEFGKPIGQQLGKIERYDQIVDLWNVWWGQRQFVQPEVFWTRRIAERIGPFREDLYFVMDYEYWMRMLKAGAKVGTIDSEVTCFRKTPTQKSTHSARVADELRSVVRPELWDKTTPIDWWTRRRLQGTWLFDDTFRKQGDESVRRGDSRTRRWSMFARTIAANPQLLLAPYLWDRMFGAVTGRR